MKKKKTEKPVRRKKSITKKDDRLQTMKVGKKEYSVGDVAWYVNEYTQLTRPKVLQGVIEAVYPKDNIEPALGIHEDVSGIHRAIRASLCGWSKAEALENYSTFLKKQKKKKKKK